MKRSNAEMDRFRDRSASQWQVRAELDTRAEQKVLKVERRGRDHVRRVTSSLNA